MKKALLLIFILTWAIIIFTFSNSDTDKSNNLSKSFGETIINITNNLHITNIKEEAKSEVIILINKPIRKIAHMFEYFVLSLLIFNFSKILKIGKKKYCLTIGVCFIYSILDEFHQTFIRGRTGQLSDCLIDMTGVLIYTLLVYLVTKKRRNKEYEKI